LFKKQLCLLNFYQPTKYNLKWDLKIFSKITETTMAATEVKVTTTTIPITAIRITHTHPTMAIKAISTG